jgi:low temperature requirement protein LtrA
VEGLGLEVGGVELAQSAAVGRRRKERDEVPPGLRRDIAERIALDDLRELVPRPDEDRHGNEVLGHGGLDLAGSVLRRPLAREDDVTALQMRADVAVPESLDQFAETEHLDARVAGEVDAAKKRNLPRRAHARRSVTTGGPCEDERVSTAARTRAPRLTATLRRTERVTPLELFFDLVFVLALTQCTALMAAEPTWTGMAKGLAVLALLWWAWTGYAWLTSVVDPEEGAVRVVMFAAMAALLVAALSVPQAFGDAALVFACAYGAVRAAHIALFMLASRDDPALRQSVLGLGAGSALGVGLIAAAAFTDGWSQGALWALALLLDMGEPFLFGAEGWKLAPGHFAERHGLILIIALGESIVAIGVGAAGTVDAGVVAAATLGIGVAAALWWLYFDVVALVAERDLAALREGRERNERARDSYSYLHFPMVAGIVLGALGLKKTIDGVGDPLDLVPAAALLGGTAIYLLAHVAFRLRNAHGLNNHRLACALLLIALVPATVDLPAIATLALILAALTALIAYEAVRFAAARERVRHQPAGDVAAE